jgi:hypothetical protein
LKIRMKMLPLLAVAVYTPVLVADNGRGATPAVVPLPPATGWNYVNGAWKQAAGKGEPADAAQAPPNLVDGIGNLAFFTGGGSAFTSFDATFEFAFSTEKSLDFPGPAGFAFGAWDGASDFWVVEVPAVAQAWATEMFWVTVSRQRPDGVREGVYMERLGGITSTPGLWHTVQVRLSKDSDCGGALLELWVDQVPVLPLCHGMRLASGLKVALPPLDRPGFIGLSANNGQGAFAKPLFRNLVVQTSEPRRSGVKWNATAVPTIASRTVKHCGDGPKNKGCGNLIVDRSDGALLQVSSTPGKDPVATLMRSATKGATWQSAGSVPAGCFVLVHTGRELQCYTQIMPPPGGGKPAAANATGFSRATSAGVGHPWSSVTVVHSLDFAWSAENPVNGLMSPVELLPPKGVSGNASGVLLAFAYQTDASHGGDAARNLCFRSTSQGASWTMQQLDSDPAEHDSYPYRMRPKSYGSEISAAPTADGGAIALVRPYRSPVMWQTRTASPGGAAWQPLARGSFPLYAAADQMVRTKSGAMLICGRFPVNSCQLSFDEGRSWRFFTLDGHPGGDGAMMEVADDEVLWIYGDKMYGQFKSQLLRISTDPRGLESIGGTGGGAPPPPAPPPPPPPAPAPPPPPTPPPPAPPGNHHPGAGLPEFVMLFLDDTRLWFSSNVKRVLGSPKLLSSYRPIDDPATGDIFLGWSTPTVFRLDRGNMRSPLRQVLVGGPRNQWVLLYDSLDDGLHWTPVNLTAEGDPWPKSWGKNRTYINEAIASGDVSGFFVDDGPVGTADPHQRIKRLDGGGHIFTSPDGVKWSLNRKAKYDTIPTDSYFSGYFNEVRGSYNFANRLYAADRRISLGETADWEQFDRCPPSTNPAATNPRGRGPNPNVTCREQLGLEPDTIDAEQWANREHYGMAVVPHANTSIVQPFIALLWLKDCPRDHLGPPYWMTSSPPGTGTNCTVYNELAYSLDGWHWQRTLREAFMPNGPPGSASAGLLECTTVLPAADGGLHIYCTASSAKHGQYLPGCSSLQTYWLRQDGWIGLQQRTPATPAVVGTRTLLWGGGDLVVNTNASGSAGRIVAQVSDQYGVAPLKGFSFTESEPLSGAFDNASWHPRWRTSADGRDDHGMAAIAIGTNITVQLQLDGGAQLWSVRGRFVPLCGVGFMDGLDLTTPWRTCKAGE